MELGSTVRLRSAVEKILLYPHTRLACCFLEEFTRYRRRVEQRQWEDITVQLARDASEKSEHKAANLPVQEVSPSRGIADPLERLNILQGMAAHERHLTMAPSLGSSDKSFFELAKAKKQMDDRTRNLKNKSSTISSGSRFGTGSRGSRFSRWTMNTDALSDVLRRVSISDRTSSQVEVPEEIT